VPLEDRIATFDQDGTLWTEHPLYTQAEFMLSRVRELAPRHPEWRHNASFEAILSGDFETLKNSAETDWAEIIDATHGGMSIEAFTDLAAQWLKTAKHPRFNRLYTELVYQPMLEAMDYLRANGFKTYIVTGGGQEFVRVYAQAVYGVPTEQVIGSFIGTKYEYVNGKPTLTRLSKLFFSDNNAGKAIGINLFIGKRPFAAFGNSTGDQQMLEWVGAGAGARLKMLVLHDDAQREYAYGPADGLPNTKVGTFSVALMNEAKSRGWTVISMKNDWKRIFAFGP
jgi:phosphoserine phosphatase